MSNDLCHYPAKLKWVNIQLLASAWPFAAGWHCLCAQSGGTLSHILMTVPCWEGTTLPRWQSWGIEGVVSQSGVLCVGTEVRSHSSTKDLFWEGTHWTSWEDCDTYARERWPQTPLRRPRHIWRGSVWFDSAQQVSKLCDNFQVPGVWTFIVTPLLWCWTPWLRSVSSWYSCIPTPSQSVGTVIFALP